MNRRGFALIAVLWVLVVLSGMTALTLGHERVGSRTSTNRMTLARAGWARDACVAVLRARFAADTTARAIDTVDLGRGTWCHARLDDPAARIDVNRADEITLRRLVGEDSLVAALLDWRDADDMPRAGGGEEGWYRARDRREPRNGPLAAPEELIYVKGFDRDRVTRLLPSITTRGDGTLNVNLAADDVLRAWSLFGPDEADLLIRGRLARRFRDHDEVERFLSERGGTLGFEGYRRFAVEGVFESRRWVATVTGGVRGAGLTSVAVVTVASDGSRLFVESEEVR